jgi:hypothetical protein
MGTEIDKLVITFVVIWPVLRLIFGHFTYENRRGKYWEIIADNLKKAGWSWGCLSAVDRDGRTMWIVDAQRDDAKRYLS